jgi:long-chain acyl-CoA synthetase
MIPTHHPTIFKAFFEAYRISPNKEAIHYKKDSFYVSLTYRRLYVQSIQFARILEAFKLKPGDAAVIILENTPLWPVAFLGLNSLGLVAVPLNNQLHQDEILPLILHSEAKLVITSLANEEKVKAAAWGLNIQILVIDQPEVLRKITLDSPDEAHPRQFSADSVCVLAYTSGTTAQPKGVLLTHKNILANIESIKLLNLINPRDCLVSFLPLYHIYAFTVTMLLPLLIQARISFPKNLDIEEIMDCLRNTGVTVFPGVPRLFSLLHERIGRELKRRFFPVKWFLYALLAPSLPLRKYLRINLAKIILYQLHAKFGRSLRFMISGGAKLNEDVAQALYKWGFTILEGYGLTETSPVISFNTPSSLSLGSAGRPVSGVEVKIDALSGEQSGEILVRGQSVTAGYFKDRQLSDEVIKDSWFYTNDLGYLDKAGFLHITGRKNEIIVLPSGKKINPEELELRYAKSPFIEELCILQPRFFMDKDMLTAIVKPNLAYFKAHGISQIEDKIRWEIENCAVGLAFYNRVKKIITTNEPLPRTILGKLKRSEIAEKFAKAFKVSSEQISIGTKTVQEHDPELLASPFCQEALKYLSRKAKKPVNLDDHLELDLGLDSLERVGLFFDFQKLCKVTLDEKTFFFVQTVRDVLRNLESQATAKPQGVTDQDWPGALKDTAGKDLERSVSFKQTILSKAVNILFIGCWQVACQLLFLLSVKGKNHLPKNGPYILCPNHASYLDAFLVAAALDPRAFLRTYFLGFRAYIDFPLVRWSKKLFRLIPIEPGLNFSRDLRVCSWVLQNSKVLCIFPEGRRSVDGQIQEFKAGVGILIKELGAPVVPVYIKGAERAWPVHQVLPRPAKIEVIFGKPLTPEELTRKKKEGVDTYKNIVDNLRESLLDLQGFSFRGQGYGKKG